MKNDGERQFFVIDEWRRFGAIMPVCVIGMMLVAVHAYTLGVMFVPLEQEFGWTRSQISAGPLVTSVMALLLAPFGGRAVDRFGPRRVALIGVPAFSLALGLIGTAGPSLFSWLALYVLLGFALILIFPSVWTAAIAVRFNKNRGLALAIALSGTGLAAAFAPFAASRLVEAFGWRGAYFGLGLGAFVIAFPLVVFLFDRDGIHRRLRDEAAASNLPKVDPRELRSPKFLRLAAAAFVYAACATMIGINAVPILIESGFSLLDAAEIAGLIGIGTIIGRFGGGFLLDMIDGRFVAIGSALGALLSALMLLATYQQTWAASLACFLLGLAAGAELDACAYLTTRHFDRRNFAAVFAVISALSGLASGISPIIASVVFDLTGSYDLILWAVAPVLAIACLLFFSLGRYPEDPLEPISEKVAPG